jgi:hypothetical protein
MSFIGTVISKGTVQFPPEVDLPVGSQVRIEPLNAEKARDSVWDVLKRFDGIAKDLPIDLAANHDHYAHGKPRKQ